MAQDETEWSLQQRLTRSWLERKFAVLNGERLFLVAWELMTNFKINDARRHWNSPSIDFVFLDHTGSLVLVELKRKVLTPRDGWSVICQVTHRAHELAAGFSHNLLETAYIDCYSGKDGRAQLLGTPLSVLEAHAQAFSQPPLREFPGTPVRRLVMANTFGPSFNRILACANTCSRQQIVETLGRYKPRGEIRRYLDLPVDPSFIDPDPVHAVTPEGRSFTSDESQ